MREIEFGESRSAKYAIFTNLDALNFDFIDFFALFEGWIEMDQIHKIQSPKNGENDKFQDF